MKIDPYKHKERYIKWKNSVKGKIKGISNKNSKLILNYLLDMEHGLNVASGNKKGARSYISLNTIKTRMIFLAKKFKEIYNLDDIIRIKEIELHKFFTGMKNASHVQCVFIWLG